MSEIKNEFVDENGKIISLNFAPMMDITLFTQNSILEDICRDFMNKIASHYELSSKLKLNTYIAVKVCLENFIRNPYGYSLFLKNGYYSKIPKRYNPNRLKERALKDALNYLADFGWIRIYKGFYKEKISSSTRVIPRPKLMRLLKTTSLTKESITLDRNVERIILKDSKEKKKRLLDYKDNVQTNEMRELILNYESFIENYNIEFNSIPMKKIRFKRVFNNSSFESGGRYYSNYQNIPSDERSTLITCNNEKMVEIDYSGLHINMLYGLKKMDIYDGDVYTVEGFEEYRNIFKIALQIAINAKSRRSALAGMNLHLRKNGLQDQITAREVLDSFAEKHHKISEYFFSGIGLHLQYLDSEMVTFALIRAMRYNIPLLPIHDSFLTRKCDIDFTQKLMIDSGVSILKTKFNVEMK